MIAVTVPGSSLADGEAEPALPSQAQFQELMAHPADAPPPEPSAAQLAASESAYENLSDTAALAVARDHLSDILQAQLIPELDLEPGEEVEEYLNTYSARISRAGPTEPDAALVVESSLPLRAPEAGDQEPLDGDLVESGDHFEADNAPVEAEIPADLEDGIDLPAAGVTIAPAATEKSDARPVSDEVFYANAAGEDSDYLLAPTATGAEVALLLRSPESPESFPLDVEMPVGASLTLTTDGDALSVSKAGEPVVGISAPRAWDAAGQEVPTRYSISDDKLTIEVPHDGLDDILWPITVDPFIHQYHWGGQGNPYLAYWLWGSSHTNDFNGFYDNNEGGVTNRARADRNYVHGSFGQWAVTSIGDSLIERVDYFNWDHIRTEPGGCTTLGIWNTDQYQWAAGTVQNPANGSIAASPVSYCQTQTHQTRRVWVGASDVYDGPGGDPEAQVHSLATFALSSNAGYRANRMSDVLRSAHVYRYVRDDTAPTLNVSGPLVSSQDPLIPSEFRVNFTATDNLAGVSSVTLEVDGRRIDERTQSCSFASACSLSGVLWEGAADPEVGPGSHTYRIVAVDQNGNARARTGQFTLDPTEPELTLAGPLADGAGEPLASSSAGLEIQASDFGPVVSSLSNVKVSVDGAVAMNQNLACSPCPSATNTSFTYSKSQWGAGPNLVRVTVTDRAGNTAEDVLMIDDQSPGRAASCPSVSPAVASGGATLSVAEATSAAPTYAIGPSEGTDAPDVGNVDPSLVEPEPSADLQSTGSLSGDTVAAADAGQVTVGDSLCLVPTQTTATKTDPEIVSGDAAIYANSAPDTDTIVRPTASGETLIQSIRGSAAPASFSWRLGTAPATELRQLASGAIAVVDPEFPAIENISVPPQPMGAIDPNEVPDAATQLDDAMYEVAKAEHDLLEARRGEDDDDRDRDDDDDDRANAPSVRAVIPQPYIVDATGQARPTSATLTSSSGVGAPDTLNVASTPDARAIVVRVMESAGKCRWNSGLRLFNGPKELPYAVGNETCILESGHTDQYGRSRGVFARLRLWANPATHFAGRLRVFSSGRGLVEPGSPFIRSRSRPLKNPNPPRPADNSYPDPADTLNRRTNAVKHRGAWCARVWQHTLLTDNTIGWRSVQNTHVCDTLNPFNGPGGT